MITKLTLILVLFSFRVFCHDLVEMCIGGDQWRIHEDGISNHMQ